MSCHRIIKKDIGKTVSTRYGNGTVVNAYTMLNPENDMYVIDISGSLRKVRREDLLNELRSNS